MTQIQFPNKFPGKCCKCGDRQWSGTAVCVKSDAGFKIFCERCDPNRFAQVFPQVLRKRQQDEEQRVRSEQEKALIEATRVKLGLNLQDQTSLSYRQDAWCDVSEWSVPFINDGTDEEFALAVRTPRQSLAGNLRASQGVSLKAIDRQGKRLILTETVALCD
jgi:hypothetical protein